MWNKWLLNGLFVIKLHRVSSLCFVNLIDVDEWINVELMISYCLSDVKMWYITKFLSHLLLYEFDTRDKCFLDSYYKDIYDYIPFICILISTSRLNCGLEVNVMPLK